MNEGLCVSDELRVHGILLNDNNISQYKFGIK